MALNHNEGTAVALWGEDAYRDIPKSVFAAIAWHLANLASYACDEPGMAERRFMEEWDALLSHGLSTPSKKMRASIASKVTVGEPAGDSAPRSPRRLARNRRVNRGSA